MPSGALVLPAQREVERVGQEFAQTLELQAKNVKAESEKALTDAKREHASLTRYLQAVEEYDRRWDATFDAWKREHDAWEQTDPASRGPEPVFPDVGQPPSMPGA